MCIGSTTGSSSIDSHYCQCVVSEWTETIHSEREGSRVLYDWDRFADFCDADGIVCDDKERERWYDLDSDTARQWS